MEQNIGSPWTIRKVIYVNANQNHINMNTHKYEQTLVASNKPATNYFL
jgi:hypothetical protein